MSDLKVRIKLVPLLDQHQCEGLANSFMLPSGAGKKKLTALVNLYLEQAGKPKEHLFEFTDALRKLRLNVKLGTYIRQNEINTEDALELIYAPASKPPSQGRTEQMPDWVSSLSVSQDKVWNTCFDGSIHVQLPGKKRRTCAGIHSNVALKSVAAYSDVNSQSGAFAGCKNGHIYHYQLSASSLTPHPNVLQGHSDSVECLDVSTSSDSPDVLLASASWDHGVNLWQVNIQPQEAASTERTKKPKATPIAPTLTYPNAHNAKITSVVWEKKVDGAGFFTGSGDHTIKVWNVNHSSPNAMTFLCNQVVTSLAFHEASNVLVSGHPDHCVRVWDTREGKDSVMQLNLNKRGHASWVSDVAFREDGTLASVGYDKYLCLWDLRSNSPVHKAEPHNDRIFAVAWGQGKDLYSAGADKVVRKFEY